MIHSEVRERDRGYLERIHEYARHDPNSEFALFLDVYSLWNLYANDSEDPEDAALWRVCIAINDGVFFPLEWMLGDLAKKRVKVPDDLLDSIDWFLPVSQEERDDEDWDGIVAFHDVQRELRGLPAD